MIKKQYFILFFVRTKHKKQPNSSITFNKTNSKIISCFYFKMLHVGIRNSCTFAEVISKKNKSYVTKIFISRQLAGNT